MGALTVLKSSFNEGQPLPHLTGKELDSSSATHATEPATEHEEEANTSWDDITEAPPARTPIIISEDDAHHPKRVKETYFHRSQIKDTLIVQKHHKVNDDEVHEENPHLEDFLIPHHSVHVERPEEADKAAGEEVKPKEEDPEAVPEKKECCAHGILHHTESATLAAEEEQAAAEKPKRKVQFGSVLVRDYEMILGDHPCCSYGPPVTLDWDYLEYEALEVNEYEFHRPPRKGIRKMGLNYYKRKQLLSDAGYTDADFKLSKKRIGRAKFNRSLTRQILPLMKVEDAIESSYRKIKRLA